LVAKHGAQSGICHVIGLWMTSQLAHAQIRRHEIEVDQNRV